MHRTPAFFEQDHVSCYVTDRHQKNREADNVPVFHDIGYRGEQIRSLLSSTRNTGEKDQAAFLPEKRSDLPQSRAKWRRFSRLRTQLRFHLNASGRISMRMDRDTPRRPSLHVDFLQNSGQIDKLRKTYRDFPLQVRVGSPFRSV